LIDYLSGSGSGQHHRYNASSSGNGDNVAIEGISNELFVPSGYVSGHPLSDTVTFDSQTFSSLGVKGGTYVWTWGTGTHAHSFTLQIGPAVSEPSSLTLLGMLLKETAQNDPEHKSLFFTVLSTLAQKHGSGLEQYIGLRGFSEADEGYAVYFREGEKHYVVAILRGDNHIIPGDDTQYLLLLDHEGRLLDKLSCAIRPAAWR
jgi:hypothetical protein